LTLKWCPDDATLGPTVEIALVATAGGRWFDTVFKLVSPPDKVLLITRYSKLSIVHNGFYFICADDSHCASSWDLTTVYLLVARSAGGGMV
jgi:hypothetical protein